MQIKVTRKVNDTEVEFNIEERDLDTALVNLSFFAVKDYCPLPGFEKSPIVWEANKATGEKGTFTYFKRKAFADGKVATSTMGKYKDGGVFWNKFEIYEGKKSSVSEEDLGMKKKTLD